MQLGERGERTESLDKLSKRQHNGQATARARPALLSSSCLSPFWHAIVFASCSTTNTHTCTHTHTNTELHTVPINAIKYQNLSTHCASIRSAQLNSAWLRWLRLAQLILVHSIPFDCIWRPNRTELN